MKFSHLFAITWNALAIVWDCWDGVWNPILEGSLSYQRVEDLLNMHIALVHLQLLVTIRDNWEWGGLTFFVLGAYAKIKGAHFDEE